MWKQPAWHIYQYIRYFLKARYRKGHGIHSPLVYAFVKDILEEKKPYYCFDSIENTRKNLRKSEDSIFVEDFGTGISCNKKIANIATNSLKNKRYAQLIFRIVAHYKPQNIIELGTSLGITTSYIASANKTANIYSFEGANEIAKLAEKVFHQQQLTNISLIVGDITSQLPLFLAQTSKIDMVFFDANHKKQPSLDYFNLCIKKASKTAIFIFDDIYWSKEMKSAWQEICADKRVRVSIDLFSIGVVFLHPELKKKHYLIRHS